MISAQTPHPLIEDLRRLLGKGKVLSRRQVSRKIAATRESYRNTITNGEAAFVLAADQGVRLDRYLEQDDRDRIREIRASAPSAPVEQTSERSASRTRQHARDDRAAEASAPCRHRPVEVFDCCALHPKVSGACRRLFRNGHYAEAVEHALKVYNNSVKDKAGRPRTSSGDELDGASLMAHVFSISKPLLKINDLGTRSEQDEQTGYMQLAQGAMTGLRNPRAHEHELRDDPERALELIGLVSYLMRKLDEAKRTRRRRKL